jgi:MFS family permease
MRDRIFGGIGVAWGTAILVSWISKLFKGELPSGNSGYVMGQYIGLLFAFLLVGVGLYYLTKSSSQKNS